MKLTLIQNPLALRLETEIQNIRDEVASQMSNKADTTHVDQLTTQVMAAMGLASNALRRNNT